MRKRRLPDPIKTGWPPGLLQDDSRGLSMWFASRVDARETIRRVFRKDEDMLGMLGSLAKAAVSVVEIPVAVAADVVTLGGSINDKDQPYTATAVEHLVENVQNAADPRK